MSKETSIGTYRRGRNQRARRRTSWIMMGTKMPRVVSCRVVSYTVVLPSGSCRFVSGDRSLRVVSCRARRVVWACRVVSCCRPLRFMRVVSCVSEMFCVSCVSCDACRKCFACHAEELSSRLKYLHCSINSVRGLGFLLWFSRF